jgi:hypothetical protein
MYGLKDVNNTMEVGYHGNDCLNWLEKLVVTEMKNVTQREIDLAYGLKDGQVSNFTHFIQLVYIILM